MVTGMVGGAGGGAAATAAVGLRLVRDRSGEAGRGGRGGSGRRVEGGSGVARMVVGRRTAAALMRRRDGIYMVSLVRLAGSAVEC